MANPKAKEYYSSLKKRSILVLKSITKGEDYNDKIAAIDEFLLSQINPQNFFGSKGLEVKGVKGFEQTCNLLKQHNIANNPRAMTTLSFYQALSDIKAQIKAQAKKRNR